MARLYWGLMAFLSSVSFASDFGTMGLIDTPTARMHDDATFSTTVAYDGYSQAYGLSYQATPWLEGTFRYTGYDRSINNLTWDRNYEVKLRLLEEGVYVPQIALGIRDVVGTGVVSSEYLVGSKRLGNLDLSLGLGWGRLAGSGVVDNPLSLLSERFETRSKDVGRGGTFSVGEWFSGDKVGMFGGLAYNIENAPIRLLAEYNPDLYSREVRGGANPPQSPFSVGIAWDVAPGLVLTASHQHGHRFGLSIAASLDTSAKSKAYKPQAFLEAQSESSRLCAHEFCNQHWIKELKQLAGRSGVLLENAELVADGDTLVLKFSPGGHRSVKDALERYHRQAVYLVPDSVKNIDYVVTLNGYAAETVRLPNRATNFTGDPVTLNKDGRHFAARELEISRPVPVESWLETPVNLGLKSNITLFDPDNPLGIQVYANVGSQVELADGLLLAANLGIPLADNLDGNTRKSDSVLPRVRSEGLRYLKGSDVFLDSFLLDKRGALSRDVNYRLFGGYLEQMYAGLGGEVLYRPHRSRLAFGLSGAYAHKRDYHGGLELLDYSVITGHGSVYWASPFYNYDFGLHVGRYLAEDVGATLEVRRTFDNGWMVGLWSSLTNVSFEDFGEGSFDKGIFLRMPIESIFGNQTPASSYTNYIRPIQRDGGQRLEGYSGQIWWDLREARHDALTRN